jgi:3-phenylpropionate/trans-cinnamate dioxygenase ferredoxin reductase subunit
MDCRLGPANSEGTRKSFGYVRPSPFTLASVVIVGAGHGGFQAAASLRQRGFGSRIVLVNDEVHLPYQRPPLSKAHIKGSAGPEGLTFRPAKFYQDQQIELIAGHATSIGGRARKVQLASGGSPDYGHLVLATGARSRLLDLPNADLPDVKYLRNFDESEALRSIIPSKTRAVIIGAGFIGQEFAATARIKGLEVDVIELGPRVMARAVTPAVSDYFQKRHHEAGIRIHLGVQVTSIVSENGRVTGVSLGDSRYLPADIIVVGIGVLPNLELAAEADLPVSSGIIVDECLQTADPNISAIVDCALFASPRFGGSLQLESVQNATDHARCAAARLTGDKKAYDGQPWFWSDQGDDKLQIAGLAADYDQVVMRGAPATKTFSAFCDKGDKLVGIESINRAGDHMFGRRLLGTGCSIPPAKARDEASTYALLCSRLHPKAD